MEQRLLFAQQQNGGFSTVICSAGLGSLTMFHVGWTRRRQAGDGPWGIGGVIVVQRRTIIRRVPVGLHGLNGVDEMGGEE